jgi:hypothetical protein
MHIATTTVLHRAYTFDKSLKDTIISGVALATGMTAFAVYHCYTDEFLLHTIIFGKSSQYITSHISHVLAISVNLSLQVA